MAFHKDSFTLKQYLSKTIPDLIDPLEEMIWDEWEPGDDPVDGREAISLDFFCLAYQIAYSDRNVSVSEMQYYADIANFMRSDSESDYNDPKSMAIRALEFVKNNNLYMKISKPFCIRHFEDYDILNGTNYSDKAKSMFFRFANAMAKADGQITSKEEIALASLKNLLYPQGFANTEEDQSKNTKKKPDANNKIESSISLEEVISNLQSLIGLDEVKNDVLQLVNFLKVQQLRQSKGMPSIPISRHLVFYGNPGTGKTTVARLLAQIYKSLGVISQGHLVETDRSGLVAGYLGQTALKVNDIVEKSLGGVLFIDEAYALTTENQDYGQEAIDTLIKLMEDNRNDLVVIVAGYTDKMGRFLASNPGLKSRFNKYFSFEDYKPEQLAQIFELFCTNAGFNLSSNAYMKLQKILLILHDVRDETFGNARLSRNIFEKTINNQANRIVLLNDISEEILSTIEEDDIPGEPDIHF